METGVRHLCTFIACFIFSCLFVNNNISTGAAYNFPKINKTELNCLARTIYYESRGEPIDGQYAVGFVVMNRLNAGFSDSICGVVKQGLNSTNKLKCQFNGYCDNVRNNPKNNDEWKTSIYVAKMILFNLAKDPTAGAKYFHSNNVNPYWQKHFKVASIIERHTFYR